MTRHRPVHWPLALAILLATAAASAQVFTGPSTRRTSVVLSEIHYHPPGEAVASTEFVELYNSSPIGVDLSGWKLRGDADFDFPAGTRLEGGEFLLVAADPTALQNAGVTAPMVGPWTGDLSNKSGTVRLRKASGGIVLEVDYEDESPWPLAADGAGHSLVLRTPAIGESRPEAWGASTEHGGSPGGVDPAPGTALQKLVISEVRANSEPGDEDFVEFFNPGSGAADLSGCFLTQNRDLPGYTIPGGTVIPGGGYLHFNGNVAGFEFDATGDSIYLRAPDGLQVLAAMKFDAQDLDLSWGGIGDWRELENPTPGTPNAAPLRRPVVINEIHYHPAGGDNDSEFIELHNTGTMAVDLSGWKIRGGVDYTFPTPTSIDAGGFLVVTNPEFGGSLSNAGDRVALRTPSGVLADEVVYFDGGRWPSEPDGGGTSLQLIDPRSDNALAPNWSAGDESAGATPVVVEATRVLDLGHQKAPTATRAFFMIMDEGEVAVDDFEVIVGGSNRVANGDFSSDATGWKFFGTHSLSSVSGGELLAVARDGGGDVANLVETTLTSSIAPGTEVTVRATCRWISGTPQVLLGLNGGYIEAAGTLPVPQNVGTPGTANVGAGNTGPAITEISHSPLLPQAGQPITISARVDDPDGIAQVRLRYRIDPATSTSNVTMAHQGDGVYTGTIPAQTAGKLIAFQLLAVDTASGITRFPEDAPDRECLARVGSADEPGDLSTMHIWMTDANHDEWRDRVRSSNLDLDGTFVSDGQVYYNCGFHYAGSPNGVTIYDSPTGNPTGYNIEIPGDQFFLNTQRLTLDRETTRDATRQRERLQFWFLEKLGLPNLHRRYVHLYFNGVERDQLIIEDVQKPNRDIMDQWFDDKGRLTKTNPWFEYGPNGDIINTNPGPRAITNRLNEFLHGDGTPWTTRDRWTWSHASGHEDAHDFSGVRSLIDAAQAPDAELVDALRAKADMRQWMRTFAHNDLCAYWDTFGNPGAKNAYLFESLESGIWSVIVWDMDVGLGVFNDAFNSGLFPGNVDDAVERMYDEPALVRDYWGAMQQSLDTFFRSGAGTEVNAILQETYDVLRANDAAVTSPFSPSGPDGLSVDGWIAQRRTYLLGQIAGMDAAFAAGGPATSTDLFVTITGMAPLTTNVITANGVPLDLDWSTVTAWSAQVPLTPGANTIQIEALDDGGASTGSATLNIQYTGAETWPALRINEWMAANPASTGILDPADGNAEDWFELYNPTATGVALGGWFLSDDSAEPQQFRIPDGFVIPPGGYLMVWADDEGVQNNTALRPDLHVSFKLGSSGESIILSAPDASEVDRVDFGEQTSGVAQRRVPDGGAEIAFTLSPTPLATNTAGSIPELPEGVALIAGAGSILLSFDSADGGLYQLETSEDLAIWIPSGAPIIGDGAAQSISLPMPTGGRLFVRIRSF